MTILITAHEAARALSAMAGGYLRNPIREPQATCLVCTTPVDGYAQCYPCRNHQRGAGNRLADRVGFCTYAIAGQQSSHVMHGYKSRRPGPSHNRVMALLLNCGLQGHTGCASRLQRASVTHWATVPSLAGRHGEHPLHRLTALFAPGAEVSVDVTSTEQPRDLASDHFRVAQQLPPDSHVLAIDDTWTSGAHVQSLVLALRAAGAAWVSVLVVARWLKPDFDTTRHFIRDRLRNDYEPLICPWTGW